MTTPLREHKQPKQLINAQQKLALEFQMQLRSNRRDTERREKIYQENKNLIAAWRSIPWYLFWKRPSFEEMRFIVSKNWEQLHVK